MKELIEFSFFPEPSVSGKSHDLPEDVFAECVQRWPEFKKEGKTSFEVQAEPKSLLATEIIDFIEKRTGKSPNWRRFPAVYDDEKRYQLFGLRIFDCEDMNRVDEYWCIPKENIAKSGYRHDDGVLEIEQGAILSRPVGRPIIGFPLICTESIKKEMEEEGFSNIAFKPVKVSGKKSPEEPLWEVSGKVHLPPVTNKLVNDQGEEPDGSAHGCWVDDLFFPPILTYDQEEIATAVGSFDVAVTAEKWHSGIIARRSPFLICSNRFRSWCQDRGLKLDWVPVQVEGANESVRPAGGWS